MIHYPWPYRDRLWLVGTKGFPVGYSRTRHWLRNQDSYEAFYYAVNFRKFKSYFIINWRVYTSGNIGVLCTISLTGFTFPITELQNSNYRGHPLSLFYFRPWSIYKLETASSDMEKLPFNGCLCLLLTSSSFSLTHFQGQIRHIPRIFHPVCI